MNWINQVKSIAIVGESDSGKTALAYKLLDKAKKEVYVYGNPHRNLITERKWNVLFELGEIEYLSNCVLWIDEPPLYIKTFDKKANEGLRKLLSIARQRGITLIITTNDTRFITRGLESYIDVWLIKDIEVMLIKQGSIIKKILQRYILIDESGFRLKQNEYIFHSRKHYQLNSKYTFKLPKYWSEAHSKPFSLIKIKTNTGIKSANESANIIAKEQLIINNSGVKQK